MADWNFAELWSIWQFQIPQKHVFQLKNLRQVLFSIKSFALWCKFSQFCIVCVFCLFYIELYSCVFHCNVSYCPVLSVWYRAYMVKSMVWWVWWVCGGASGGKVSLKVAATDKHGILPGRSSPCHFYLIISEKVKVAIFMKSESCDRQTWNPPGTIIISRKIKNQRQTWITSEWWKWTDRLILYVGDDDGPFLSSLWWDFAVLFVVFYSPSWWEPGLRPADLLLSRGIFWGPSSVADRPPSTQGGERSFHPKRRQILPQRVEKSSPASQRHALPAGQCTEYAWPIFEL